MKILYIDVAQGKAQHHAFMTLPRALRERGYVVREVRRPNRKSIAWADVIWNHGLTNAVIDLSRTKVSRPLVVRMHTMETYKVNMALVDWRKITKLVVLAKHLREHFLEKHGRLRPGDVVIIPGAIDMKRFYMPKGERYGNRLALVSEIHWRKGMDQVPAVLGALPKMHVHHIGQIVDRDARNYLDWELKRRGFADRYHYYGKINYGMVPKWLEGYRYMLLPTYTEGQPRVVGEAMSMGVKPLIHRYRGCDDQWPADFIWDDADELPGMLEPYEPERYRAFIRNNYSIKLQTDRVEKLLKEIMR